MTFLTALALLAGILVGAPYLAHRLRRRRAEDVPFPPARLVDASRPRARRRSRLEDRALFATRSLAVAMLALLGATPLVRCSRLSLQRMGGASVAVAIVLDDSMSMRARTSGAGVSRFERARTGARELLASMREGDAVAIVLAGSPARVALAPTTDIGAGRGAIDVLTETDRATELDGAIELGRELLGPLPQIDRRIVIMSDLADGRSESAPLGESSPIPIWVALPELRAGGSDCAVLAADRSGVRVDVRVACGPGATAAGRQVVVEDQGGGVLGHASPAGGPSARVTVLLPSPDAKPVRARLLGADAIASDDVAPVVAEAKRGSFAVVADPTDEAVVTGGAPIAEQALTALKLDSDVRPLPAFPDRLEDLAAALGVVVDDPPGFTPEQRHALDLYLDAGGFVLLALGPHAALAPLGASLEPILGHAITWNGAESFDADPTSAIGPLSESGPSLRGLGASRRAGLAPDDVAALEPVVKWSDGSPLIGRRIIGRGEAWVITLPISVEASDLPLRPAFLALLDGWARQAMERSGARRSEVGSAWRFPGAHRVEVEGPGGPLLAVREDVAVRVVPALAGAYRLSVDGAIEERVASPVRRELDMRPRSVASSADARTAEQRRAPVDVSAEIALALLALLALEMALRMRVMFRL